jgi:hypothetical protein
MGFGSTAGAHFGTGLHAELVEQQLVFGVNIIRVRGTA